jgi:hypothetical protein
MLLPLQLHVPPYTKSTLSTKSTPSTLSILSTEWLRIYRTVSYLH